MCQDCEFFANKIQNTLINDINEDNEYYQLCSYYKSADIIGGDWFDYFQFKNKLTLIIGDVTGHGIGPALISCMIKGASQCFQSICKHNFNPGSFLNNLNQVMYRTAQNLINMTILCLTIDFNTGTISYASAAHPLPIDDGKYKKSLFPFLTGYRLGCNIGYIYETNTIKIPENLTLLLYTDGLIDNYEYKEQKKTL